MVLILVLVIFWSFWQSVFYTERQAEFGLEVWGLENTAIYSTVTSETRLSVWLWEQVSI